MKHLLLFILITFLNLSAFTQPLIKDANTLLLLNFNNNVTGADGELPIQSQNLSYQTGIHGQALYISNNTTLRFDTTRNFNSQQGTYEFWIRPEGPGTALGMAVDGGLRIGVGTWTVMDINIGVPGLTRTVTVNNIYETNTWYHLAFTWDSNTLKLYKNGLLITSTNVGYSLPVVKSPHFNIGSSHIPNDQLIGRIDELRISNIARGADEIYENFLKGNNIAITNLQLTDTTSIDLFKTWKVYMNRADWWKTPKLISTVDGKQIEIPNVLLSWTVEDTTVAKLINGDLETVNYGTTFLKGKYQNIEVKIKVNVLKPFKEMEKLSEIDNFLLTPASCHKKLIPVVMVAYIPTKDGIYLDKTEVDQWFLEDLTLVADTKKRIIGIAKDAKFMLEEGSKFRGYKNPNANPYIGYKVIDIIFIYEPIPRNRNIIDGGQYKYFIEQVNAMDRINGSNYVNNLGVKEFWVFQVGNFSINFPESNMSSPKTGDVSNSFRYNDDLPVYNHTYVWYGYNYSRVGNEAVHNHGHQIEAMLTHANWLQDGNTNFFWKNFVGVGPNNERPLGRSGDTHHPPNAVSDYDYQNTRLIESDIMDWKPEGGTKTPVNKETWEKVNYKWIKDVYQDRFGKSLDHIYIHAEAFWYVAWMQSMPGYGNQIVDNRPSTRSVVDTGYDFEICSHSCDHQGHFMFKRNKLKIDNLQYGEAKKEVNISGIRSTKYLTNWMDIIYDWDNFYNKGLYSDKPQQQADVCKTVSTIVSIDKQSCGGKGSELKVPVRVKSYSDVAGLQFKIASGNNEIAEITGVSNIHPNSGLSSIDFAVVNKKLVLTYADVAKTLPDDAILFNLNVRLNGEINTKTSLVFEGEIFILDNTGSKFNINVTAGEVCIKVVTSNINGTVSKSSNVPLENIEVNIKNQNQEIKISKSTANGSFKFDDILNEQTYTMSPSHNETVSRGIDISDLFLLRRHMQGLNLFNNPYTYLAADLNRDKVIDISDLFILRRIMQGLITELPDKVNTWRFVPKSYSFPTTGNPLAGTIPDALSYNPLTENKVNQDFIGVKYGDLDHSAVQFNGIFTQNRSASDMELNIQGLTAASGSNITVEVNCKNFSKGAVMQFSLQWPTDKLQLLSVPSGDDIVIKGTTSLDQTLLSSGKLGFIWETDDFSKGNTLTDNSVVYKLRFKILGANNNTASIQNSITPKNAKFLDVNGSDTPVKINSGTISIAVPSSAIDQYYAKSVSIFPNPTNGIILFNSDGQDLKNLEIRSLDGKLMLFVPELKDNSLDASHLLPGIYQLKGHASHVPFVRKVIIVK